MTRRGSTEPSPKQEALEALRRIRAVLDVSPLKALDVAEMRVCLDYAEDNINLIQELKRIRKPKAPAQPA